MAEVRIQPLTAPRLPTERPNVRTAALIPSLRFSYLSRCYSTRPDLRSTFSLIAGSLSFCCPFRKEFSLLSVSADLRANGNEPWAGRRQQGGKPPTNLPAKKAGKGSTYEN